MQSLPLYLINQAVQSHLDILTESHIIKDQVKHSYLFKCVDDVKQGNWAVPAIRHMLKNLEALIKHPFSKTHKVSPY